MVQIHAVSQLINKYGQNNLPLNIKFLIEGEEEIGSPSVMDQLTAYPELFRYRLCNYFRHRNAGSQPADS